MSPDERLRLMLARLEMIGVSPGKGKIRGHVNRDGTIDAELRIKVTNRVDVRGLLIDIEEQLTTPRGSWISIGFRYEAREDEPTYARFAGLSQVTTHYQRGNKAAYNFDTAKTIFRHLRKKGRRKPQEIMIRLHWNEENARPKRGKH